MRLIPWILFASAADAAEVVWVTPPSPEDAAWVGELAGATRPPLGLADLRSAASDWTPADDAALEALSDTLEAVRMYETRLDGELVIMRELMRADEAIAAMRTEAHRETRFKVLAYQGFAVDRYFSGALGGEEAAPYVTDLGDGNLVVRPWLDAVASSPAREVTPYDIAEAPQRVAFSATRDRVRGALPASLIPADLPAGATVYVDGVVTRPGPTGTIRVPPGRHLVHVDVDGHIVERFDLRLGATEEREIRVALSDAALTGWWEAVAAGGTDAPPAELVPHLEALGGTVWIVHGTDDVVVAEVTATGVTSRALERPKIREEQAVTVAPVVSVQAGWLSSGNFALDAVGASFDRKTVNAGTTSISVGADVDAGAARFGAGVETAFTLGAAHVATYNGDSTTRTRPFLYVSGGLRPVQVAVGYVLPFHPTFGLRAQVPLGGGFEAAATGWLGLPSTRSREAGGDYESKALYAASLGVGWRGSKAE